MSKSARNFRGSGPCTDEAFVLALGARGPRMQRLTTEDGVSRRVVPITADGNCLFRAIAHCVFSRQSEHLMVRNLIVDHVAAHWEDFSVLSTTPHEDNYRNASEYREEMGACGTYGTLCEVVAAARVFPYAFEVWRNGSLYLTTSSTTAISTHARERPAKRLLFTGRLSGGHFDVLEDEDSDHEARVYQTLRKRHRPDYYT